MVISIHMLTSQRCSPQLNETMISMTGNSSLSSLHFLNGSNTSRAPHTLSLSSLITKIYLTSRILKNSLADKLIGCSSFKISTLNGLSLPVLRWVPLMLFPAKTMLILLLTIIPPLLSPILLSSTCLTSPFPSQSLPPLPLISSLSVSSPPFRMVYPCSLTLLHLIGLITMDTFTLKDRCMFPHQPASLSSTPSTLLPPWITWASSAPKLSLNVIFGGQVSPPL